MIFSMKEKLRTVDRYRAGSSFEECARHTSACASTVREWVHELAPGAVRDSKDARALTRGIMNLGACGFEPAREKRDYDRVARETREALSYFIPRIGPPVGRPFFSANY